MTRDHYERSRQASAIADQVEPRYRTLGRRYSCTGHVANIWDAAYEAAFLALAPNKGKAA